MKKSSFVFIGFVTVFTLVGIFSPSKSYADVQCPVGLICTQASTVNILCPPGYTCTAVTPVAATPTTSTGQPTFTLVGKPTLTQTVISTDVSGNSVVSYTAIFNVQINTLSQRITLGLPNAQYPAFPGNGSGNVDALIFKNGVQDATSTYSPIISYTTPANSTVTPDGKMIYLGGGQIVTIPVNVTFTVRNPGSNVYGVKLAGIQWFPVGASAPTFTIENDWATSGVNTNPGTNSPNFSLSSDPTITWTIISTDMAGNNVTAYSATFNVRVTNGLSPLMIGLNNAKYPAFPFMGKGDVNAWVIYKNGVVDQNGNNYNATVSYSQPPSTTLTIDGTGFTVAPNQTVTVPVTLTFQVRNPGGNVYGVKLNGVYWSIPQVVEGSFTPGNNWITPNINSGSTNPPTCYTFSTNLSIGSTGADVTALQTWLLANGFDIALISSGQTPKGNFGFATQAALIKYQASIGVNEYGYLGPLTRAKINASCGVVPTNPQIKITSPVGGEVWTEASRTTDTLSGFETYRHDITWSGVSDTPEFDFATPGVRAYLEKLVNSQYVTVGRIMPFGYGSIAWVAGVIGTTDCVMSNGYAGSTSCYNYATMQLVSPGQYYVRVVDERTGSWDRSHSSFTIAAPTVSTNPLLLSLDQSSPLTSTVIVSNPATNSYLGLPILVFDLNAQNSTQSLKNIWINITSPTGGSGGTIANAYLYQGTAMLASTPVINNNASFTISSGVPGSVIPANVSLPYTVKIDVSNVTAGAGFTVQGSVAAAQVGAAPATGGASGVTPVTGSAIGNVITVLSSAGSTSNPTPITYQNPTVSTNPSTVNSGNYTSLSFSFPSDAVRETLMLACPSGVSSSQGGCNTTITVPTNTSSWSTMFTNTSGSPQNVVVNYYVYESSNPNYAHGASANITVAPASSTVVPPPTVTTTAPTATLTIEGTHSHIYFVGDTDHYVWSSTNADTFSSTYTRLLGPTSCGGSGPWEANSASGQSATYLYAAFAGCYWQVTFTATNSKTGQSASDTVYVKVYPALTPANTQTSSNTNTSSAYDSWLNLQNDMWQAAKTTSYSNNY